jgi:hypothetical protein
VSSKENTIGEGRHAHLKVIVNLYPVLPADYDAEFYKNIFGSFFPFLIGGVEGDGVMIQRMINRSIVIGGNVDDATAEWKHTYSHITLEYLCLIVPKTDRDRRTGNLYN